MARWGDGSVARWLDVSMEFENLKKMRQLYHNTCYFLFALALLLASASCIDDYELPESETENMVVIYGEIVSESDCVFKLRSTASLQGGLTMYKDIPNAKVTVCGTDGQCFTGSPIPGQRGNYVVPVGKLDPNVQYYAQVCTTYGDYKSEPMYPLNAPEIAELSYEQPREDKVVDLLVSTEDPHGSIFLMWQVEEYWEIKTPFEAHWQFRIIGNEADQEHFPWNGQPGNEPEIRWEIARLTPEEYTNHGWRHDIVRGAFLSNEAYGGGAITHHCLLQRPHTDHHFRNRCCVRVRQMAITREEYEFRNLQKKLTGSMGGLFTQMPSELPTNIQTLSFDNGLWPGASSSSSSFYGQMKARGIGYVGVRGYTSEKQIYINPDDVSYVNPDNPTTVKEKDEKPPYTMWMMGYQVADYFEENQNIVWTQKWWVDYRSDYWGGGEALDEKPRWWEER